jgi:hypothetical protein
MPDSSNDAGRFGRRLAAVTEPPDLPGPGLGRPAPRSTTGSAEHPRKKSFFLKIKIKFLLNYILINIIRRNTYMLSIKQTSWLM